MGGEPRFSLDVAAGADGRTTVAVAGEVDLATSAQVEAALREALPAGPVLLDLRQVTFMDSTGIRVLSALTKESGARGWGLTLCSELQAGVLQVLELTGMTSILRFEDCGTA